jgi:hypothetical protein
VAAWPAEFVSELLTVHEAWQDFDRAELEQQRQLSNARATATNA